MTKEKKFGFLIRKGIIQPLQNVPYHNKAPVKRILMQNESTFPDIKKILPGSNYHIAIHLINKLPKRVSEYVEYHAHKCDEINLILSENSKLVYEIWFENEKYIVSSPSTVYIPKGISHKMKVIKGKGTYVCIIMSKTYKNSLINNKK